MPIYYLSWSFYGVGQIQKSFSDQQIFLSSCFITHSQKQAIVVKDQKLFL